MRSRIFQHAQLAASSHSLLSRLDICFRCEINCFLFKSHRNVNMAVGGRKKNQNHIHISGSYFPVEKDEKIARE